MGIDGAVSFHGKENQKRNASKPLKEVISVEKIY